MPTFDFKCTGCSKVIEKFLKTNSDKEKLNKCSCGGEYFQIILSAPSFSIAAKHTFDGKAKVSGKHIKEKPRVPINIIDEKPGGGYTVTTSDPSAAKDEIYGK